MLTRVMDLSLQSVRTFFRKNMETCLEWLSHVRGHIVSIAIHAGMPAVAIRHGFAALKDLVKLHVRILCVHVFTDMFLASAGQVFARSITKRIYAL